RGKTNFSFPRFRGARTAVEHRSPTRTVAVNAGRLSSERVPVGRDVHSRIAGGDAGERLLVPVWVTRRREAEELSLPGGRPLEEALERRLRARSRPRAEAHPVRVLRPEDDVEGEPGAGRRPEGRAAVERAHRVEEDGDTPVQPRTPR